MPRLTRKYRKACELAGVALDHGATHDVLYGYLEQNRYRWNGEEWRKLRPVEDRRNASIRILAHKDDVEIFAGDIAAYLIAAGARVERQTSKYLNEDRTNARVYINFTYDTEDGQPSEPDDLPF